MSKKTFASDNYSGVHPAIMQALLQANEGHAASYGADEYTAAAIAQFKKYFGHDTEAFFVYNGTGANVMGLAILTRSFNSIICAELAHINVDESTAPEKFLGCRLLPVPAPNGKMTAEAIEEKIIRMGDQHHPQAKVISLSQTTEYGTVYSVAELQSIATVAEKYNLYFHMDGSRIANAAVALKTDFVAFTLDGRSADGRCLVRNAAEAVADMLRSDLPAQIQETARSIVNSQTPVAVPTMPAASNIMASGMSMARLRQ